MSFHSNVWWDIDILQLHTYVHIVLQADEYSAGVKARLSFLIHKVMAEVKNKYNPQEIRTILEELLKGKQ